MNENPLLIRRLLLNGLLFAFVSLLAPSSSLADSPPNIVLIVSDDQSWTDYGFMGHDTIQTPHLDQLARESVLFRRGYVPTALCRPSLATLISGHYAHRHQITGNDPARDPQEKDSSEYVQKRALLISQLDNFQTLPRILSERGYLSFQSGKWWEGGFLHGGFTHGMTRGFPNQGGRHGDDGLTIGREGMQPVLNFIDHSVEQGKPFFVWYAPFLPHEPHNPPDRLLNKYLADKKPLPVARYQACCEWFDETCGELTGHLEAQNLTNNTLVVYVTDNGWIQSPQGSFAERSKQSPYEAGVRTPIMLRWPDHIPPADRPELCSSIDIFPTILAAAGAEIPDDLPGINLLPALTDGTEIERTAIFGESFAHDVTDILNPEASLNYRWIIEGQWKLILTYDGRQKGIRFPPEDYRPQLFDLTEDPDETRNLAEGNQEIVDKLADQIENWWPVTQRQTISEWSDAPVTLDAGK